MQANVEQRRIALFGLQLAQDHAHWRCGKEGIKRFGTAQFLASLAKGEADDAHQGESHKNGALHFSSLPRAERVIRRLVSGHGLSHTTDRRTGSIVAWLQISPAPI